MSILHSFENDAFSGLCNGINALNRLNTCCRILIKAQSSYGHSRARLCLVHLLNNQVKLHTDHTILTFQLGLYKININIPPLIITYV